MWDGSCSSPNWSWRRVQGSICFGPGWLQDSRCFPGGLEWKLTFKSLSSSRPQQVVSYIYIFHTQHISIIHSLLFYDIHHRFNCIWIFTTVRVKTRALRHLHGSELRPGYLPGWLLSALPQSWGIALKDASKSHSVAKYTCVIFVGYKRNELNSAKAAASAETFQIESTMFSLHVIFCAWQAPGNYALDGTPIKMLRMHPTEAWAPVRHPLLAWTFYGPWGFSGKMAEFSTKFCKYGSCAVWSGLKRTISATDMSLTVECKLPPRSNRPWPILGCQIPRIWEQSKNLPSFTCPALSSKCVCLAGFEWIQAVLERASALSVILSCYSKWNLGTWVASLGTCKAWLILGLLMHHGNSFGEHISMRFHQGIQPPVTGWPTAMRTVGWVVLSTRWHFLSFFCISETLCRIGKGSVNVQRPGLLAIFLLP